MNGKRAHADYASLQGRRSEAIGLDRRRGWDRIPALMAGQAGVPDGVRMRRGRRSGTGRCALAYAPSNRRVLEGPDAPARGATALIRYVRGPGGIAPTPGPLHRGGITVSNPGFDGSIGLSWRQSTSAGGLVDTHVAGRGPNTGASDEAGKTTRGRDESMFAFIEAIS